MTADWNWFFSTLSQSAAAIVGIFGAFIITKIFSNQTVFLEKSAKLRDLLIQAQKISDTANSYNMRWYNDHYNVNEYSDFHKYLDEHYPKCESTEEITGEILDEFIANHDFSIFTEKNEIISELRFIAFSVFKENKTEREQREAADKAQAELAKNTNGPFKSYFEGLNMASMASAVSHLAQVMPGYGGRTFYSTYGDLGVTPPGKLAQIRDNFYSSYREAKHHSRLSIDFLASIKGNPESPRQIGQSLILVLTIFFMGVIYPLSFIPATGAPELGFSWALIYEHIFSFKGFLLTVISVAFSITVSLFFNTHMRMKYPRDDIEKVEKLTHATHYCATFKFLDSED